MSGPLAADKRPKGARLLCMPDEIHLRPQLTPYQGLYYAWLLTRRTGGDSVDSLASTLVDAQVDLNPHQVDAALFACRNPLSRGVILADEVGLGKTIEAGLVISQRWAERRRHILIIVPANLRKQWHQELQDKFGLQGLILEAENYNALRKDGAGRQERQSPFLFSSGAVICSYPDYLDGDSARLLDPATALNVLIPSQGGLFEENDA